MVFVVGESLVDVVVGADGVDRRMPGGSPMNVAFGLARLGVSTTLLTALGGDAEGGLVAEHLASAGVEIAPESVDPRAKTSTALARLAADGSASYEFDLRWDLPAGVDASTGTGLVHTGSIGSVIEPGGSKVLDLFENVATGVLRSFDPNVRPAITPDRAAVLARVERFARAADILKLSDEDARWLFPGYQPRDVEDWALNCGVRLFAMTRGADGCVLATPDRRLEQPGIPAEVVDTIGAGDAFMAALIAGVTRWGLGDDLTGDGLSDGALTSLASLAQRSASATVARAGAYPPIWTTVLELSAPEHPVPLSGLTTSLR